MDYVLYIIYYMFYIVYYILYIIYYIIYIIYNMLYNILYYIYKYICIYAESMFLRECLIGSIGTPLKAAYTSSVRPHTLVA
jgi:hypothetical protein